MDIQTEPVEFSYRDNYLEFISKRKGEDTGSDSLLIIKVIWAVIRLKITV